MADDTLMTVQMACRHFRGLSVRTAQRRAAAGYERAQLGSPEPGDDKIEYLGKTFSAPLSWWKNNLKRRPLQRPGRPPETPIQYG